MAKILIANGANLGDFRRGTRLRLTSDWDISVVEQGIVGDIRIWSGY